MKHVFIMPRCGVDMEEGVLAVWLKQPGDYIKQNEIVYTIESNKALQDIESPCSGYLRTCLAFKGDSVPVGEPVAIMTTTEDEPY